MDLAVDTAPGTAGALEPLAFRLGERRLRVLEIADRWLSTSHSYYKVRADDGALYILRHDLPLDRWEMTLFQAPGEEARGIGPWPAAPRR